jgi:hypothetical protein
MTAQGEHGNSGNLRKGRRGCAPPQFVEPPILRKLALINFVTLTRAREWCADTMSELGQQTDPLEPAGRRCGCWPTSPIPFYEVWLGANDGAGAGEVADVADSFLADSISGAVGPVRLQQVQLGAGGLHLIFVKTTPGKVHSKARSLLSQG